MTCIVAIKKKNKIVLGCDGYCGSTWAMVKGDAVKVVEKEDFFMGVSGAALNWQVLEHLWELPERTVNDTDYGYVLKRLVPSIKNTLIENNAASKDNDKIDSNLRALFIYKDKIYYLLQDFCCLDMGDFATEGSGASHALGAIEAVYATNKTAKQIAEIGLRVASKWVPTVNDKFLFKEITIGDAK